MYARVIRVLLRLYPADFRRRHGAEAERSAHELGTDASVRRRLFVMGDLLKTLPRAWGRAAVVRARWWVDGGRAVGSGLRRDVGFALRNLRRHPLHGAVVVGTLGLAIGANAAVFTVMQALLLERLPYDSPERVARVWAMAGVGRVNPVLAESPLVEGSALYFDDASANLVEGSEASRVRVTQVSQDFFRVLGVGMALGRGLPAEAEGGAWAVLSHGLWLRAFGADPYVIGRPLRMSGHTFHVVGVAPPRVDFPARTDVWLSLPVLSELYGLAVGASVVTRMRPGVTSAALERALQRGARSRMATTGDDPPPEEYWLPTVHPLPQDLTKAVRLPLQVLTASAVLILLLGCVNLAAVTIARVVAREEELGVRRALGAGRAHLFGQLVLETMVPAMIGGVLSIFAARAGVPALRALLPPETPGLQAVSAGGSLLLAAGMATAVAVLLAGLLPAIVGSRAGVRGRGGGRATDDPRRLRLNAFLAAMQVALAVVLVIGAGLMGRSLQRLHAVPLGFDVDDVLTFEVRLPRASHPDEESWGSYLTRVLERLQGVVGVAAVGATTRLPLAEGLNVGYHVLAEGAPGDASQMAIHSLVTSGYFEGMGIPVLRGRTLGEAAGSNEVVLSRGLARVLFPDADPIGRTVVIPGRKDEERAVVAGVVADVRPRGPRSAEPSLMIYQSLSLSPRPSIGFALRTMRDPAALVPRIRPVLAEIDPRVPPFAVRTTGTAVAATVAADRAVALVSGFFALCALVLAALGIYGLMAQAVARRRREMGIRLAVGAEPRSVLWLVLRSGLRTAIPGIAAGLACALAVGRIIESLLYDVTAADPFTLAAVPVLLASVALLAALLPARRAARTDPMESLRVQ